MRRNSRFVDTSSVLRPVLFQMQASSSFFEGSHHYFTDEYYNKLPRLPKKLEAEMSTNHMIFNRLIKPSVENFIAFPLWNLFVPLRFVNNVTITKRQDLKSIEDFINEVLKRISNPNQKKFDDDSQLEGIKDDSA